MLIGFRAREDFDANENGITLGRIIKSTGAKDFVAMEHSTFGAANSDPLVGPVVIHEIMVDPGPDGDNGGGSEFVELINISGAPVDLAGWHFDAIDYTFGPGVVIQPGELIVVVPDREAFLATHDGLAESVVFGSYANRLDNGGESLRLLKPGDPEGDFIPAILVDRVSYDNKAPWPLAEPGVALQRIEPAAYGNEPQNWGVSVSGGTPGDFFTLPTIEEVLVGIGGGRGFSIPAGEDQLQTLPWTGIDRISIRFSEYVVVTSGDLQIAGVNQREYNIVDFQYDRPTATATWTLAQPIRAERLLIELSAGVHDGSNLPLDGNWTDAVSSFPSGNGVIDSGDVFQFRLNVVPGDVTGDERVDRADLVDMIHHLGDRSATAESLRRDLTGDGQIDVDDLRAGLLRLGSGLPSQEPGAIGSATPQAVVDAVFERAGGAGAAAQTAAPRGDDPSALRETRLGRLQAAAGSAKVDPLTFEPMMIGRRAGGGRR